MTDRSRDFHQVKRIAVKVGTTQITEDGAVSAEKIARLAAALASLRKDLDVVLISSGAVSAGIAAAGLPIKKSLSVPYKQAAAAVGQSIIMADYAAAFAAWGIRIGQVLLSRDVMQNRDRYRNASNTLATLLKIGVLPIVNENDTMAVDEILVGDNDRLAAMVAQLVGADLLILLSDVDGFYENFGTPEARLLPVVEEITDEIRGMAGDVGSKFSTGGMQTKLDAAWMCKEAGIHTVLAPGENPDILTDILAGKEVGTLFPASGRLLSGKKHWLRHHLVARGQVVVDDGAAEALCTRGKSLLARGVVAVHGDFTSGDGVSIEDLRGKPIATGITNYGREQLVKIMGRESGEIESVLGEKPYDEVVHRDQMILADG